MEKMFKSPLFWIAAVVVVVFTYKHFSKKEEKSAPVAQ